MRKLWSCLYREWVRFAVGNTLDIMTISYDLTTNQIKCKNWVSEKIKIFSGELTPELWKQLEPYCRAVDENKIRMHTRIYIWAGFEKKHLAYLEPVKNYLDNYNLLQTGQGFDTNGGIRYGQKSTLKCPTCKRIYD